MSNKSGSAAPSAASRSSGQASARGQGLHQPSDDQRLEDKLENVDLQSRGAKVDDHLRDSRSKGVKGGYDDSIEHDADEKYSGAGKKEGENKK